MANPNSEQANPNSEPANPNSEPSYPSSEQVIEKDVMQVENDFNVDDVIIAGVEEALDIQVPFDMKLRYKSAGDPNADRTGTQKVRWNNYNAT